MFLWHHAGEAVVHMRHEGSEATRTMKAGDMLVIPRGTHFRVEVCRAAPCCRRDGAAFVTRGAVLYCGAVSRGRKVVSVWW